MHPARGLLTITLVVVVLAGVAVGGWLFFAEPSTASDEPVASTAPTSTASAAAGRIEFDDGTIVAEFLGDSLTYGQSASTEANGYRQRVVEVLRGHAEVHATRWGASGFTTRMVSAEASVSPESDLVVLELGTNDVKRTPISEFQSDYELLVSTTRRSAPDATLVCLGVWATEGLAAGFDPLIAEPCRAAGGIFLPMYDLYDAPGLRGPEGLQAIGGVSDMLHPNDRGHAAIAARVERSLGL